MGIGLTEEATVIEYRPRIADGELAERMDSAGAVLIEGPKSCGKTATASRRASTVFRMDTDDSARDLVDTAPELLLGAAQPVLFDEWQVAPKLWNLVRRQVDDLGGEPGRFLLTGSATPEMTRLGTVARDGTRSFGCVR